MPLRPSQIMVGFSALAAIAAPVALTWPPSSDKLVRAQPTAAKPLSLPDVSVSEGPALASIFASDFRMSTEDATEIDPNEVGPPAPRLTGIAGSSRSRIALLVASDGETNLAEQGTSLDGWLLESISADSVVLTKEGESVKRRLAVRESE